MALLDRDLLDLGVMRERVGDRIILGFGDEDFAVRPIPGRNLMAPPDLARDAPGLDVFHPIEERRLPLRRHEHGFLLAHRRDRRLRQRLGVDVPLVGEERLEHRAGAVAVRHHVRRRLDLFQEAAGLEVLDDALARREAIEAVQRKRLVEFRRGRHAVQERGVVAQIKPALDIEHVDQRQIMAAADLEVVEVVRRRDLHRPGTLFRIGVDIADDRNAPADQRQNRVLADEMLETLVVRMHRDGGIAEHGLRPRRRHDDECVAAFDRIFDVPEVTFDLDLLHLEVGDGGLELGVPIDQPLVLVDEALAVERDEHFHHRARQPLVHGEAFARPIAGGAEPLQLADDGAAGLRLPFPHALDESFAPHLAAAGLSAFHQLPLDHGLRCDAGVVGARLPQHVLAAHPLEPAENVLQGVVERMAHMQRAGDVGRRDDDAIGARLGALGPAAAERAGLLPCGVNAALDCGGGIGLFDHRCFASGIWRGKKPAPRWVSTPQSS